MKSAIVASVLAAAVAAQPHKAHGAHQHGQIQHRHQQHQKHQLDDRALVVITKTDWVTTTAFVTQYIDSSTTYMITDSATSVAAAASTPFIRPGNDFQESPTSASYAVPSVPSSSSAPPTSTSTSVSVAAMPTYQPPTPTPVLPPTTLSTVVSSSSSSSSSTSVFTPPPPPPSPTPTPSSSQAPPPPPPPPSTTSTPVVAPAPTVAPAPAPGGGSGSGSHAGDITYYDLGLGACGQDNSGQGNSLSAVALPHGLMGTLSNSNPDCGKTITIYANGKSTQALVIDKCMGCDGDSIDVSPKVFLDLFGSLDGGREKCTWDFN